jgi:hypothetical protein
VCGHKAKTGCQTGPHHPRTVLHQQIPLGGRRQSDGFEASTGEIALNIVFTPVTGPSNDLFANRIDLGSAATVNTTGTNDGYTGESGEPAQQGSITSAWWSWTAPANGTVTIDTFGSNFDTFLTVATGLAVDALSVLGQNDDAAEALQSEVSVEVVSGESYEIAVDGYEASTGEIALNVDLDTP